MGEEIQVPVTTERAEAQVSILQIFTNWKIVNMPQPQLGTTSVGTELLSVDVTRLSTTPTTVTADVVSLDPFGIADVDTERTTVTAEAGELPPVILNPNNLQVTYDESRNAFVSDWFREISVLPDDVAGEVVVTMDIGSDEPVTAVVERDDSGDGTVDAASEEYEAGYGQVSALSITPVEGSYYRVVFPDYARDDDVDAVRVAHTWPHRSVVHESWSLDAVEPTASDIGSLLNTFASALYRLDARTDELHDNQRIETASGDALELLATTFNLSRRDAELDSSLRYRTQAETTVATADGTLSSIEQLLKRLFVSPTSIKIGVSAAEPTLTISVPTEEIESAPYNRGELEETISDALPSGYSARIIET